MFDDCSSPFLFFLLVGGFYELSRSVLDRTGGTLNPSRYIPRRLLLSYLRKKTTPKIHLMEKTFFDHVIVKWRDFENDTFIAVAKEYFSNFYKSRLY